jgi:hypothetical protein
MPQQKNPSVRTPEGPARFQEAGKMMKMTRRTLMVSLAGLAAAPALAVEELFSRTVQVFQPTGEFPQRLIRLAPPTGAGWKDAVAGDLRLKLPASVPVDDHADGDRILQAVLSDAPERPRPILRVDAFAPEKDDPTEVDADYTAAFVEAYPQRSGLTRFELTDSGMLVLRKKWNLVMVGGAYHQGAVRANRLQCAYLSRQRHLFLTFDCAEKDWEANADTLARILLSMDFGSGRGKR